MNERAPSLTAKLDIQFSNLNRVLESLSREKTQEFAILSKIHEMLPPMGASIDTGFARVADSIKSLSDKPKSTEPNPIPGPSSENIEALTESVNTLSAATSKKPEPATKLRDSAIISPPKDDPKPTSTRNADSIPQQRPLDPPTLPKEYLNAVVKLSQPRNTGKLDAFMSKSRLNPSGELDQLSPNTKLETLLRHVKPSSDKDDKTIREPQPVVIHGLGTPLLNKIKGLWKKDTEELEEKKEKKESSRFSGITKWIERILGGGIFLAALGKFWPQIEPKLKELFNHVLPVLKAFWNYVSPLLVNGLRVMFTDVFAPLFSWLYNAARDRIERNLTSAFISGDNTYNKLEKVRQLFDLGDPKYSTVTKLQDMEGKLQILTGQLAKNTQEYSDALNTNDAKKINDANAKRKAYSENASALSSDMASLLNSQAYGTLAKDVPLIQKLAEPINQSIQNIQKSLTLDRNTSPSGYVDTFSAITKNTQGGKITERGKLYTNSNDGQFALVKYPAELYRGLTGTTPETTQLYKGEIPSMGWLNQGPNFINMRNQVIRDMNARDFAKGITWYYTGDGQLVPHERSKISPMQLSDRGNAFVEMLSPKFDALNAQKNPEAYADYVKLIHGGGLLGFQRLENTGKSLIDKQKRLQTTTLSPEPTKPTVSQPRQTDTRNPSPSPTVPTTHIEDGTISYVKFNPSDKAHAAGGGKEQVMAKDGGVLDVKLEAIRTTLVEKLNRVEETAEKKTQELYKVLSGITGVLNGIREFLPELTPYPPTPPQQQTTQFDNLHEYRLKSFVALT